MNKKKTTRETPKQPQRFRSVITDAVIDVENRTVEVAFSSDAAIDRGPYIEILSHAPNAVDMTRLNDGAAVLLDHDWSKHIGRVEEAVILSDEGKGRAKLRFSRKQLAEDAFRDIQDEILTHVSVGYRIEEEISSETPAGKTVYTATRWSPHEISMVHTPADLSVGVGRSFADINDDEDPEPELIIDEPSKEEDEAMPNPNNPTDDNQPNQTQVADAVAAERCRIASIRRIGERGGWEQADIDAAIDNGVSIESFAQTIPQNPVNVRGADDTQTHAAQAGITDTDLERYSISRVMNAAISGNWERAGLELEISNALADARGRDAREGGVIIPHEALARGYMAQRAGQTTKNSQPVIPDQFRPDMWIDQLREQSLFGRLGMQMVTGLNGAGKVDIPRQTSGANAEWIVENADAPEKSIGLDTVSIAPSTLAVGVPISRRLRLTNAVSLDAIIQRSMNLGVVNELDKTTVYGSTQAGQTQPQGIMNMNIGTVTVADLGKPTFEELVEFETQASEKSALGENVWLIGHQTRGALRTTKLDAGSGQFLMPNSNELIGHRAIATNIMQDNAAATTAKKPGKDILFMNPSMAIWGFWSSLDVTFEHKKSNDSYIIRMFQDCGFNVEHLEGFAKAVV